MLSRDDECFLQGGKTTNASLPPPPCAVLLARPRDPALLQLLDPRQLGARTPVPRPERRRRNTQRKHKNTAHPMLLIHTQASKHPSPPNESGDSTMGWGFFFILRILEPPSNQIAMSTIKGALMIYKQQGGLWPVRLGRYCDLNVTNSFFTCQCSALSKNKDEEGSDDFIS
jgi:hypothetical protein